jgi:ParB family transcriptional regulator, chromosome partitioning protein
MPPRKKTEKADKADTPPKPTRGRKPKTEPGTVGLSASECGDGAPSADVAALVARIEAAGGRSLGCYRDPLGGHGVVLAALPIDAVAPTPYQRELSKAHADRLAGVIPKVGRFLDPIVAVPGGTNGGAAFITPNGMHRLQAMRALGARAITALILPEPEVAFRILALNTEKAHNLKDKALEVIRMARAMAADPEAGRRTEAELALEFEQGALITIGICYEKNARFSGGAYMPVVSRCDELRDAPVVDTLPDREALADKLLDLDGEVTQAVARLKASGFTSGYLKPLVVSRINPLRWIPAARGAKAKAAPRPDLGKTVDKMIESARKFDPSKIKAADVAAAAWMGGGDSADEG